MRLLEEATKRCPIALHAFVLMQNHVHLWVTPCDATALSAWVKHFAQRYALRRNRLANSSGKLFEQRYFAVPIRTSSNGLNAAAYLDFNPVLAGLCSAPELYRWSSARLHVDPIASAAQASIISPAPWYEELGSTHESRAERYRLWLQHYSANKEDLRRLEHDFAQSEGLPGSRAGLVRRPDGSRAD